MPCHYFGLKGGWRQRALHHPTASRYKSSSESTVRARALSRLQDETRFLRFHLGLLSHHFFEITASTTTCNTSHVGCDSVHESAAAALTCARLIQSWADGQWILRVQRTLQGTEEFVSYVGFLPSGPSGYMSGSPIALSHRMRINVYITYNKSSTTKRTLQIWHVSLFRSSYFVRPDNLLQDFTLPHPRCDWNFI